MEFSNNIPIYLQVIAMIKSSIVNGDMPLGSKLPSTRELALQYQINPNTAVRIYSELDLQELCFTKRGLGTFITENEARIPKLKEEMAGNLVKDYVAGMMAMGYTKDKMLEYLSEYLIK